MKLSFIYTLLIFLSIFWQIKGQPTQYASGRSNRPTSTQTSVLSQNNTNPTNNNSGSNPIVQETEENPQNNQPNNQSNSTISMPQNNETVPQKKKQNFQGISLQIVKEFGKGFDNISKFFSLFGFAYLISNFLNFWNVMVLYYFLKLDSFIPLERNWLLQLCSLSLGEGSIFNLVHRALNTQIPVRNYQKIPESEQEEWPSFKELGFTSQIFLNNVETYFNLFNCIVKIFLIKFIINFVKSRIQRFSNLARGIRVPFVDVFCFQLLSSSPGMIIPFAVMISAHSEIAFFNFEQKVNNLIHIFSVQFFIVCLLIPLVTKKLPIVTRQKKVIQKSKLQIEEIKNTMKFPQIQVTQSNLNNIKKNSVEKQQKILKRFRRQLSYKKFVFWETTLEIYNHLLFFSIPFLVGLQNMSIFFTINTFFFIVALVLDWKKRSFFMKFKKVQFWFTVLIKLIMAVIHGIFLLVYLNERGLIRIDTQSMELINLIAVWLIIIGAIVQILHTIVILFIWASSFVRKIRQGICLSAISSGPMLSSSKKKQIDNEISKINFEVDISLSEKKDEKQIRRPTCLKKSKQNISRVSNVFNYNQHMDLYIKQLQQRQAKSDCPGKLQRNRQNRQDPENRQSKESRQSRESRQRRESRQSQQRQSDYGRQSRERQSGQISQIMEIMQIGQISQIRFSRHSRGSRQGRYGRESRQLESRLGKDQDRMCQ